jgi:4-hydroxybenzoate polyprenyltransferase
MPASFTSLRHKLALYLDLIRWNRPAGWLLLLWPTLVALWLAAGGWPGWHLLIVFTLGTILMRSAGCCVNDVADRDFDRHVKRTTARPVTSGRISSKEALAVGGALALAAFALALSTNALTVYWSFAALAVALAYPFAKRVVSMPQAVLGVAFSMGIPMAFAAVQGRVDVPTVAALMLANLFWVLAYDTEYAMVDRDDDIKLGMKTSAITLGRFDVVAIVLFYLLHTALMAYVLSMKFGLSAAKPAWAAIFSIAVLLVLAQIVWHWRLIQTRQCETCFRAFTQNHWIGLLWFVAVLLMYAV